MSDPVAVAARERPILFTGAMVRAILAGTKTQTRRRMRFRGGWEPEERDDGSWWPYRLSWSPGDPDGSEWLPCPYGVAGDRLWVRETWGYTRQCDDLNGPGDVVAYAAGPPWLVHEDVGGKRGLRETTGGTIMQPNHWCDRPARWVPSIHMPRWASRLTLEVTDVRVQRLHAISGQDVLAEGVDNGKSNPAMGIRWENMQRMAFEELWTSINGAGSWNANPWVWAIGFKRIAP